MVYDTYDLTIVFMGFIILKPNYNWGPTHCRKKCYHNVVNPVKNTSHECSGDIEWDLTIKVLGLNHALPIWDSMLVTVIVYMEYRVDLTTKKCILVNYIFFDIVFGSSR